jgi:hypothetical protein
MFAVKIMDDVGLLYFVILEHVLDVVGVFGADAF